MVHPSKTDYSQPFDYHSPLWTEGGEGSVAADGVGIRLTPALGSYKLIQQIHAVTPVAGQLTVVGARLALSTLGSARLWFGAWTANTDPFGASPPTDAVVIEKPAASNSLRGYAKHDSSEQTTGALLTLEADKLVDLCVVVHDNNRVDFIYANAEEGTWPSIMLSDVGSLGTMRLGFAYKLGTGSGSLVVRSVHVEETVLRE